jgi:transcriptional regulator
MPKGRPLERIELLQGTLDLIILQTLRWGPRHGYGISQLIRSTSDDLLQVETGSLYPALHRLERKKWIAASWVVSDNNQRVKEYRLTETGRAQLLEERTRWEQLSGVMSRFLQAPEEGPA